MGLEPATYDFLTWIVSLSDHLKKFPFPRLFTARILLICMSKKLKTIFKS